ncbi:MAG TPA: hypothetical protein VK524_28775, partial [Polyangiaceae bacterium]|nr:hypothetical protein [Polyangiaceae bacterium]
TSPRCGDMEWWRNTILGNGWGRGYSVIGGDSIRIHHNWAIGVAGAGIIVASEPSYDSASSSGISIENNTVYRCTHRLGHPGILLSGLNAPAGPLNDISLRNNISAENVTGEPYRAEGAYTNVTNVGLSTSSGALPRPIPTVADVRVADTRILRTRDVAHIPAASRAGLYRIHVRPSPVNAAQFQERFEYVVKGPANDVSAFVTARTAAGAHLSEQRTVNGTAYALLLTPAPLALPANVTGVDFRALRQGDLNGSLTWLWQRLDSGSY